MSKYQVRVVMSYWQTIEVEAENEEQAGEIAFYQFDHTKAVQGEGEVYRVVEVQETENE